MAFCNYKRKLKDKTILKLVKMLSIESLDKLLSKKFSNKFTFYNNDQYIGVKINNNDIYSIIKFLK